jgi:hypothetical protein
MDPIIRGAIPVLPAAETTESLRWWTEICGFKETFRDATPPNYAGINRGDAYLHIAGMTDKELARKVGDQTMVRIAVQGIEAMYDEYQRISETRRKSAPQWCAANQALGHERVRRG